MYKQEVIKNIVMRGDGEDFELWHQLCKKKKKKESVKEAFFFFFKSTLWRIFEKSAVSVQNAFFV